MKLDTIVSMDFRATTKFVFVLSKIESLQIWFFLMTKMYQKCPSTQMNKLFIAYGIFTGNGDHYNCITGDFTID